ncbi:MAG: amidohydrolase [Alphaproteobacteria bacterium]|nr:amidohydrolase [Alphaproteobacteria bacterium]
MSENWLISADSHVVEPVDLWAKALGDKWGDAVPREVGSWQGQEGRFYFTGLEAFKLGELVDGEGELQEKLFRATEDPAVRLQCNDEDGIWAEILNATSMLYSMRIENDDLARDCCAVFNDWLIEHCSHDRKRMLGTAMIYMRDVDWAIAELERTAKGGLVQAMINCDARPTWEPYRSPAYDPFWARAEEMEIPVVLHIITGNNRDPFTLHGEERATAARVSWGVLGEAAPVLSNEFIWGGVLDRFPGLKLVLSEFEVSWLIYWIFRAEQRQESLGPALGTTGPRRPIREYMANMFHGAVDDPYIDRALGIVDPKTILWGSDFPHPRCTFPNSHAVIRKAFGNLPDDVVADITFHNAARLYDIDLPDGGRTLAAA